ncbi:transposase [Streptomyces sp. NPDC058289]|uniref:transposase n=1 Tax=Streptomyces sp. NPDC058289 TaxID=3346425 RepID=UPI0036EE51FC
MRVRDEFGELFADVEFAQAFEVRGWQGWSPGHLALLQFAENLTDRAAAHRVRSGVDFKCALPGPGRSSFDASVLSEFRARLVAHNLEERALDLLMAA